MSSRSVRRRQHKTQLTVGKLSTRVLRAAEATRLLVIWREEARSRAERLGAPAVWALADSPAIQALAAQLIGRASCWRSCGGSVPRQ
jgi:hypothetical protein